jgi:hypothetical protein
MIKSREELIETVKYVASETSRMAEKVLGKTFPIKSLTVFSHSPEDFESLCKMLEGLGKPYDNNNGPRIELYDPIEIGGNRITHLRIRKPDSERPQVGCNDFETDYVAYKNQHLPKHPENLRVIKRPEYEMIELSEKDFNVLAYVVSNE